MAKKSSLGCQEIVIEKIPKKNHLQVTFSKRRSGLFKKASELCTLCGVEIAIIVFSPAGKAFSFGHSEVDAVIDRFLARRCLPNPQCPLEQQHLQPQLMLTQLLNQIDFQRKKGEEHERLTRANEKQAWWESSIDGLGTGELKQLKLAMEELRRSNMLASDSGSEMPIFGAVDHVNGRDAVSGM